MWPLSGRASTHDSAEANGVESEPHANRVDRLPGPRCVLEEPELYRSTHQIRKSHPYQTNRQIAGAGAIEKGVGDREHLPLR